MFLWEVKFAEKSTVHMHSNQGPVAQSMVNANYWLRSIETCRFLWYLTLVSANNASRNSGQVSYELFSIKRR